MEEKQQEVLTRRPMRPQVIIGSICWFSAITYGVSLGHSAVLLPSLQDNSSSLPTDEETGSWIVSIYSATIPVGTLLGGISTDFWGRRTTLRTSFVFDFVGWILIACANSHTMLICAKALAGFAKGMAADAAMVLLDEHSDARLRGVSTSFGGIFLVAGMMLVSGLANLLEWRVLAGVAALGPPTSLICTIFLPESSVWLARHGKEEEAAATLEKLWGNNKYEAGRELNHLLSRCKKEKKLNLTTFLQPHVLKAFFISLCFVLSQLLCGTSLFVFYTVDMIAKSRQGSEPVISDLVAATIGGALRIVAMLFTSSVVFIVGRRKIGITSILSTAVCCIALGSVLYSGQKGWVPLILIFLYLFVSTSGLFVLPMIMLGEMVPSQVRGISSGCIFTINDLSLGGVLKAYPWLTQTLGIHGVFWMFGAFSLFYAVFIFLLVPETQGRSLAEIEDYFRGPNILWHRRSQHKKECQSDAELEPCFEK